MDLSCKTCKYGLFCPTWGEYKCTKKESWFSRDSCEDFKARSKDEEMPKCQCNDCLEREEIEDDN